MQETFNEQTKFSRQNLVSFVNEFIFPGTPDPEDPDPSPWPWRHLVNKAAERVVTSLTTPGSLLSLVALNPQPLPPKAFLALMLGREVIDRAAMMHQMADVFNDNSEERGIIIVSGFINKFVDEICPTPPVIRFPRLGWPFPPDPDPRPEWSGLALAIIGAQFQNEARTLRQSGIQSVFQQAGEKLNEVALSRMERN